MDFQEIKKIINKCNHISIADREIAFHYSEHAERYGLNILSDEACKLMMIELNKNFHINNINWFGIFYSRNK